MAKYKIYWGDPHIHSKLSWGCFKFGLEPKGFDGSVGDCYKYAQDIAKLDFAAVTDHDTIGYDEWAKKLALSDEDWRFTQEKAAEYYEPNRFVTFSAFEWSECKYFGHRNVYYLTDDAPILRNTLQTKSLQDLWRRLGQLRSASITVPHHIARNRCSINWNVYDPRWEPVMEITSIWGNYEYEGNPYECDRGWSPSEPGHFAQDALAKGYRMGFIGGGDTHSGRSGGHSIAWQDIKLTERWKPLTRFRRNPLGGGLTAVFAKELTRETIFEALKARRCYATTNAKIELDFKIDGHRMGEDIKVKKSSSNSGRRRIFVRALGIDRIKEIIIVRNNRDIYTQSPVDYLAELEYEDKESLAEVSPAYKDSQGVRFVFYYARVVQVNGKRAWSSPIWFSFK